MNNYKKTFIPIDDFISNIESLIQQRIVEIAENGHVFRVCDTWYEIYYENDYGMNINLYYGRSRGSINNYQYSAKVVGKGSSDRIKADTLFEQLKEIYSMHCLCNATDIVKILSKYMELIQKCTAIEKLSEDCFLLYFGLEKYIVIRKEQYNSVKNYVYQKVEITKDANGGHQIVYKGIDYYSIKSLFSILNVIFTVNQLAKYGKIDKELLKALDCEGKASKS